MHALEWIEQHGRYRRTISAGALRKAVGREKGHCTWCGREVPRGRLTWCSQACVDDFRRRCDPQAVSSYLRATRELLCELCKLDIAWLLRCEQRSHRAYGDLHRHECCPGYAPPWLVTHNFQHRNRRGRRNRRRLERWASLFSYVVYDSAWHRWLARRGLTGYWEADHIVPVCEGGGLCGPENYRILCIPCHRRVTAELAKRRSQRKAPT